MKHQNKKRRSKRESEIARIERYFKEHIHLNGKYYRLRSIGHISDIYQNALKVKERYIISWNRWWKDSSELGDYWGNIRSEKIIYRMEKVGETYSDKRVETKGDIVLTSELTELPLMLAKAEFAECIPLISEILRGEKNLISQNQELVDRHLKIRSQFNHLWRIIGTCQDFFKKYIYKYHGDKIPKPYSGENTVITLKIKGYEYSFYCDGQGMKMVDLLVMEEDPNKMLTN